MSISRLSKIFRGCAASVLVFGAAVALGSVPVRAADDEPTFDEKIVRGIMDGLGLKRDGEANINYRERAPLVIPSSRDLAPPAGRFPSGIRDLWDAEDPDRQGCVTARVELVPRPLEERLRHRPVRYRPGTPRPHTGGDRRVFATGSSDGYRRNGRPRRTRAALTRVPRLGPNQPSVHLQTAWFDEIRRLTAQD